MKNILFIMPFAGVLIAIPSLFAILYGCNCLQAKEAQSVGYGEEQLDISFRFHRGDIASSQYAIWIEDATGRLVCTLYATSFTAKGGYEYREDAIPIWVAKAKPQGMSSAQVDAITGATPRNGVLTYQWDGTNDKGRRVAPGKYKFFVEGTLYWKSRVIYSGELTWGSKEQTSIPIKTQYFNQSQTNKNMIMEIKAYHINK